MEKENNTKKLLKYLEEKQAKYKYKAVNEFFEVTLTKRAISNRILNQLGYEIWLVHKDGTVDIREVKQ